MYTEDTPMHSIYDLDESRSGDLCVMCERESLSREDTLN